MDTHTFFNQKLPKALADSSSNARAINAVYVIVVKGDHGGTWTIDLKSAPPSVSAGERQPADCTIEVADSDFEAMLDNPQLGMQLFFEGKLSITGNPMLATKLTDLLSAS